MRTIAAVALGVCALAAGQASAAPITLDFTSGTFVDEQGPTQSPDTYNQSGFKLTVVTPGNHIEQNLIGLMGFHNDDANPVLDNDLILTYSGGAFDFLGLDIAGFGFSATSLELLGSNSAFASFATTGFNATPAFTNVTWVRFSIPITPQGEPYEAVGINSMSLETAPTAEIPEPASLVLFGLGALGCMGAARRRRLVNAA